VACGLILMRTDARSQSAEDLHTLTPNIVVGLAALCPDVIFG